MKSHATATVGAGTVILLTPTREGRALADGSCGDGPGAKTADPRRGQYVYRATDQDGTLSATRFRWPSMNSVTLRTVLVLQSPPASSRAYSRLLPTALSHTVAGLRPLSRQKSEICLIKGCFMRARYTDNSPYSSTDICPLPDEAGSDISFVTMRTFREALEIALSQPGAPSLRSVAMGSGVSYDQLLKIRKRPTARTNAEDAVRVAQFFGQDLNEFLEAPASTQAHPTMEKFSRLPEDLQENVNAYMDGMIATLDNDAMNDAALSLSSDPRYRTIQRIVVQLMEEAEERGEALGAEELVEKAVSALTENRAAK